MQRWSMNRCVRTSKPPEVNVQLMTTPECHSITDTMHHALSRTCAWNQMWYHLHLRATLLHNYTIEQRGVCLHWRLLVRLVFRACPYLQEEYYLSMHTYSIFDYHWTIVLSRVIRTFWHGLSSEWSTGEDGYGQEMCLGPALGSLWQYSGMKIHVQHVHACAQFRITKLWMEDIVSLSLTSKADFCQLLSTKPYMVPHRPY